MMIVNLEEFAELCGVTAETMRVHVRALDPQPAWLVERGDRGRGYKIEPDGGVAWWKAKREADDLADAERQAKLAQLRLELLGPAGDNEEALALSGKKRSEEYAATMDRIKLRRTMGELCERTELEALLSHAAVEHRQRLARIPGEYAARMGLGVDEVAPLAELLERAVNDFVDKLTRAPAESSRA